MQTSYRFSEHGARSGKLVAEVADGTPLADLAYGDTAEVRVTNRGRRRRKDPSEVGFYLDPVKGQWLSDKAGAEGETDDGSGDPETEHPVRVIPYVRDDRNILVLRLAQAVPEEVATTLRYALERGIEAAFQLEDSELASEALPDDQHRGRMLFTESAEGGAGVLRRLQAEPDALAIAARTALGIVHFDPDTGDDTSRDEPGSERCEKACYDCLLSYGNQFEHAGIDRHTIRDLLLRFASATTSSSPSDVPRGDHADELLRAADTELERTWLRVLIEGDYRLPDAAQPLLEAAGCRPDFLYSDKLMAVFIDGPVHDRDDKRAADAAAEARLLEAGYGYVRFDHDTDWQQTLREHENIFGKGRQR